MFSRTSRPRARVSKRLLTAALLPIVATACALPLDSGSLIDSTDVYIWLASYKDAFVSCGPMIAGSCPEENLNFARNGTLSVSKNGVGLKKAYVQFGLPILPAGTVVEEAYFEMYHPGQNEDGQTDAIRIPFGRTFNPWTVSTITLKNEPNKQLAGAESSLKLRSNGWSGSPDISAIVRAWYAAPQTNYGFYIFWPEQSPAIEKGFYSNNDVRRRINDLGLSPRLLLKVHLPAGMTAADIDLPPIPADNDLPFDTQTVLMARSSAGVGWPADWGVRRGD